MTAGELVALCAQENIDLVGRTVMTEAIGDYPGGPATVTKLQPEPEDTEMVYQVTNPNFDDGDGRHSIGVFEYEDAALLPKEAK